MKHREAKLMAVRLCKEPDLSAKVVRILSTDVDPIRADDSGWDVEVQTGLSQYRVFAAVETDLSRTIKARDINHARDMADDLTLDDFSKDNFMNLRISSVEEL